MKKFKIKVGDFVKVIAGSNKGSEGRVVSILKKREKNFHLFHSSVKLISYDFNKLNSHNLFQV